MIYDQIRKIKKDLTNLMPVLDGIRRDLDKGAADVKIQGKFLRQANLEQPSLFGYYDETRVHLQSLSNYFEILIVKRRAEVIRFISENSKNDYGERLKEKLIEDDETYVNLKLQKLEVDEVLELAKSICNQFEQRSYTLNNIAKLIVAQADDEHLMMNMHNV